MKKHPFLLLLIVVCLVVTFGCRFKPDNPLDESEEEKLLKQVSQLKEVIKKESFIDSLSNGQNGITIIVQEKPTEEKPYYWIQVGYNNTFRLEVYYNFYVYPKDMKIMYLDTESGNVLNLSEWREGVGSGTK